MATVEPVAAMISETGSEALETNMTLDFGDVWAHDLAGRAAAFQLTAGGMEMEKAAGLAVLLVDG